MRRFTPFIVIGILLISFFIIGLIFDRPASTFSIWNQLIPPEKGKIANISQYSPLHFKGGGKPTINLASIIPVPRPGGGKPTINLASIIPVPRPGGGKPTINFVV